MTKFGRNLPEAWMNVLRGLSASKQPNWWRDLLEFRFVDVSGSVQPLFLAVRDGYLNAYVEGQSVMKIGFDSRQNPPCLRAKIHHKYLYDGVEGQVLKTFDGSSVDGLPYKGAASLQEWVKRAQTFARLKAKDSRRSEKQCVAVIAGRNAEVIDLEMALPGTEGDFAMRNYADRIDIVALEPSGEKARIAFYEVKLFSNPDLLANNLRPKVLVQLARYEAWLAASGREAQVINAYHETCKRLAELRRMQGQAYISDLIYWASESEENIEFVPELRLIIVGYDQDQPMNNWHRHEAALEKAGIAGTRLIMAPRAEGVLLPRSQGYGEWKDEKPHPEDVLRSGPEAGEEWCDAADDILLSIEGSEAFAEASAAAAENATFYAGRRR